MKSNIKNIFGVATAILVLLGLNTATNFSTFNLPFLNTEILPAEEKELISLKDFNDAIVDIAEKTNPAVVTVNTEKTQEVQLMNPFSFFGDPRGQIEPKTQERTQKGLGSGVIVSEDGLIITNNHVIAGADEIKIRLYNGDEIQAELIGADPQTDIAVLKIDAKNLPAVGLGNSDRAKVGSFVLAIGSPLSETLAHTVSFGIVSARGRSLDGLTMYGDYIQTDAAINPGNSGGALIDMDGKLIGINSAIASRSGGNDGIGFAIPINLAKRIMDDLMDDGEVSRGYLGIYPSEVDQIMAEALGMDDVRGILVVEVEKDTPAEKYGLKDKDIIVSINGEKLGDTSSESFRTKIAAFKPGDELLLGVVRDEKEMKISIVLGKRPDDNIVIKDLPNKSVDQELGFSVEKLTNNIKRQLDLGNDTQGVIVYNIRQNSKAYERGLRNGDVITAVKKTKVGNTKEFYEEIRKNIDSESNAILLTVERQNFRLFVAFELN
jgi:serine protease Do